MEKVHTHVQFWNVNRTMYVHLHDIATGLELGWDSVRKSWENCMGIRLSNTSVNLEMDGGG